ncbi:Lrp/AsnC family transcriptional regulator [Mesorhizobium sp. M0408]|uniref:Lrp/AsnC family transcriptional regulator n=1 Tax=Mesorhizobium sp. M0408 TaxID=2956942 RepID=UPI00333515AB
MRNGDYRPRLDPTDLAIIEIMQEDGRIGISELGRRVGLSQPATSERVKRLEERGVITGYKAVINSAALGLGTMAVIRLRTTHIQACLKKFGQLPEVVEVLRVTGEDCFLVKVVVPSPPDLESIVDSIGHYGTVTTNVVLRAEQPKRLGRELMTRA